MVIKSWSGLIVWYKETKDRRLIPQDHHIMFPLNVPVYVIDEGRGFPVVGKAFNFQEVEGTGIRATLNIEMAKLPAAMRGIPLYPEVDIEDVDVHEGNETFEIFGGRLKALALGDRPTWEGMAPVLRGGNRG